MISFLLIFISSLNRKNPANPTRSEELLPPNSLTNFWRCHGLIGSFLQTGFDSVRFAALLSAIKSGDLRGSLRPKML